ncbi:AcrR family transcriptional regulator [Microbacterium resistens]|uniref:AcrR family transcriptional regulator n=1 Tax=Microbacterium resistens TaxID=156977 RepID=A0ABU1S851_9MICO|nr:ScbR family autoregulator-binding transcription factor [Microbacterium resistens]MDR6865787.1 AcrR family transcriptional regulator [Microbacterium resistens]
MMNSMKRSDSSEAETRAPKGRKPQQLRGHMRRQSLIEGAARVFERVGYGAASLSDIVREADSSPGSLYFYFKSKKEIALAIIQEQNARTAAVLLDDPGCSAIAVLILSSAEIIDQLIVDPVVSAGIRLSLEQGTFSEPTADYYREWIDSVSALFQRAKDEGEIVDDFTPEELGRTLVPYFTGVHVVSNVMSDRKNVYSALDPMWRVLIGAAVAPERRANLLDLVHRRFSASQPKRPRNGPMD